MGKDELVTYDSGGNHVVVMHRGNMYKVPVAGDNGEEGLNHMAQNFRQYVKLSTLTLTLTKQVVFHTVIYIRIYIYI